MKEYKILRLTMESNRKLNFLDLVKLWFFIMKMNPISIQPTIGNKMIGKPLKYLILPKIKIEPPSNIKEKGGDPNLSTSE